MSLCTDWRILAWQVFRQGISDSHHQGPDTFEFLLDYLYQFLRHFGPS